MRRKHGNVGVSFFFFLPQRFAERIRPGASVRIHEYVRPSGAVLQQNANGRHNSAEGLEQSNYFLLRLAILREGYLDEARWSAQELQSQAPLAPLEICCRAVTFGAWETRSPSQSCLRQRQSNKRVSRHPCRQIVGGPRTAFQSAEPVTRCRHPDPSGFSRWARSDPHRPADKLESILHALPS